MYQAKKDYVAAVNHILAAKYIIQLIGGDHHPEVVSMFLKLGGLLCDIGVDTLGFKCYNEAKRMVETVDPVKHCEICTDMAEMLCQYRCFQQSADLQKIAYTFQKQHYGADHQKTTQAKQMLEFYIRYSNESKKYELKMAEEYRKNQLLQAQQDKQEQEKQRTSDALEKLIADDNKSKPQKKKNKKSQKK